MPGLGQGQQDTKIIELFFIIAFSMRVTLKLMSLRLINKKTPLLNLYSYSPPAVRRAGLWAFVCLWLNSYEKKIKFVYKYNIFIKFSTSYEILGHLVFISLSETRSRGRGHVSVVMPRTAVPNSQIRNPNVEIPGPDLLCMNVFFPIAILSHC